MYADIWAKYKERLADFPDNRRPLVGAVIQELRVSRGIPQYKFSDLTDINLSTLKSLENDHLQATSAANLEKCAKVLKVSLDQLILEARERDPANFFVYKRQPPPKIEGLKQKKRTPLPWTKTIRIQFNDFDVTPLTPPILSRKDFFACRINLPPKRAIENLCLPCPEQVFGFISEGHNIKLFYQDQEAATLMANQGFRLNGGIPHSIRNEDDDIAAVLYLVTTLPGLKTAADKARKTSKRFESINISQAVERLREIKSDRHGRPMSFKHLADITDSLDDNKIRALLKLRKGSSVIYWDKIEDLLGATGTSMEEFLAWAHGDTPKDFQICTARDRAMIDYSNYLGIKIYSTVLPSSENHFHCGEMHIEGRKGLRRPSWARKDKAMAVIYVEEGELRLHVGKNRLTSLLKGESVYFDGSLGYLLNNPAEVPAKCFFATYPAIQY